MKDILEAFLPNDPLLRKIYPALILGCSLIIPMLLPIGDILLEWSSKKVLWKAIAGILILMLSTIVLLYSKIKTQRRKIVELNDYISDQERYRCYEGIGARPDIK